MSITPCVGCGWCCLSDQCMDSHRRYGYVRRCPDLFWDETTGRYFCRLMRDPELAAEIRRNQHTGLGCCAPLCAWRKDVKFRG